MEKALKDIDKKSSCRTSISCLDYFNGLSTDHGAISFASLQSICNTPANDCNQAPCPVLTYGDLQDAMY